MWRGYYTHICVRAVTVSWLACCTVLSRSYVFSSSQILTVKGEVKSCGRMLNGEWREWRGEYNESYLYPSFWITN